MNILLLMSDSLRADAPGFGGGTLARTPNLDALARDAVIFDNAYTPAPVCVPARQSFMMGQYPPTHGCVKFGQDLPPHSRTFARYFAEAGYYTVACGKLHHRGTDPMQGWLHRIGSETAVDWPAPGREQIGRLKSRGAEELRLAGVGKNAPWYHDRLTAQGAGDFLHLYDRAWPLMLLVSLQQPHFPYLATEERYAPCLERVRAAGRWKTDDEQRAAAAYFGMVEQADELFGRVVAGIPDLDDWLVIFTADHGDLLGDHGKWEKRSFYEGSARVPLWIRAPKRFRAGRRSANVNLVDLFPTLAELAGLPVPDDLDGQSLVPLLESSGAAWPDESWSFINGEQVMLKRGSRKFCGPDEARCFDLAADPQENAPQTGENLEPWIHRAIAARNGCYR